MKTIKFILILCFAVMVNTNAAANNTNSYEDTPIIYTVEYGPKPYSPPHLEPVFTGNYLSFKNVYVVMDNWHYASRDRADSVKADAFLIRGGSTSDVPFYDGSLDSYVELLKNPGRPTFGFCAGHQFLQMARGGICARRSGEHGYQTATILTNDDVFNGCSETYSGWGAHNYSIVDIPACYKNYAVTRTCYSTFVKHISMPLYGTQLHIESTNHPSEAGPVILGNFRNQIMPRKFHGIAEALGFPGEPGKVMLNWWKAKTNDQVIYQIFHATDENELDFISPRYETAALDYEVTGLDPDIIHYFGVRALSSAFEDSNTAIFSIKPDGHHKHTFQNDLHGYDGCDATVIYHKYADSNYGIRGSSAADHLYWWDSGLVQFRDLEKVLDGKKIIGGRLTFIFAGGVEEHTNSSHVAEIGIYRVLKNWNEGRGRNHIEAQTGEVTWNSARHNMEAWEIPGCKGNSDRVSDPVATYTIKGDGTGIAFDGTVTLPPELIQTWIDYPDSNCGLLFEKVDSYPNDQYFTFEDNDDEWFMNHPRLIVYYTEDTRTVVASDNAGRAPATMELLHNYPNPFNQSTMISVRINKADYVSLSIYNINGQLVRKLVDGTLSPGLHKLQWDGCDFEGKSMPSGIYFYSLLTTENVLAKRMILLR